MYYFAKNIENRNINKIKKYKIKKKKKSLRIYINYKLI